MPSKGKNWLKYFTAIVLLLPFTHTASQSNADSTYIIIAPGAEYNTTSLHRQLWGNHYRTDWGTPVKVKLFYLDTAKGGLHPYQSGGGRQSKTLRLHDNAGREYVLRSIDKTFGRALPEIYQNTFAEKILNDQVSIAQPFAAITIPKMAEAAKIFHTDPEIAFVPHQKALDSFDTDFGNLLYLFEQRPDENWDDAPNFGYSKKIVSTEKVFEKLEDDAAHKVDQLQFVRCRLFDMFIGDWGRHEDQWRWAVFKEGNQTIYKPIPRDRDQAFTKFDGLMIKVAKAAASAGYLQTFDYKIKDVTTFDFPARNLDRRMANETTLKDWLDVASDLRSLLTDEVITNSVMQLPPEMFANSGKEIVAKLKQRRNDLETYAKDYYLFLALEVDIPATKRSDYFEIINDDSSVTVNIYALDDKGDKQNQPFYSRKFLPSETKEIRLYGLSGPDQFSVTGPATSIKLRLIGTNANDVYSIDELSKASVYDDKEQSLVKNANAHLSNDSTIHDYQYNSFKYDKKGLRPTAFYNRDDRIFVGLEYKALNNQWRKEPFGQRHKFYGRYSINQNALSFGYDGIFNQAIGKWNVIATANYDFVRWINFFGLGNETKRETDDNNFYRIRSKQAWASIGFQHAIGKKSSFVFAPFFQSVQLLNDENRFLAKTFYVNNKFADYTTKDFAGLNAILNLSTLDSWLLPTKGINFTVGTTHARSLQKNQFYANNTANAKLYFSFFEHLVLAIEGGGASLYGDPEFYQLNSIGGNTLRGYRRERFWGETTFYNNNDLQYLFDVRSHIFNGKMGLTAFVDQGRVWKKGEQSDTWHYGYGGGIILVPFNKLYVSVQYGLSKESGTIHLELRRDL